MPRIILKCPYLKPGKTADHRANYVRYIGTRPGVDKIDDSRRHLPATKNQQQLMEQLLRDFPDTKELFEYKDYLAKPTLENASEFIAQAIDQNFSSLGKRENYVDYIAKRPRAERVGDHGLFTDEGVPVPLQEVAREVAEHPGNVWLPIVSLRREDAQRLGYDSGQAWRELLRAQADDIARCFKIRRENFRWYASFHNESHHPHVHMVCYSTDPREGYLTVKGIEAMKSGLAKQIFRQDLLEIYSEQTERRNELTGGSEEIMRELCGRVEAGAANERAGQLVLELSERLKNTGGKKVYGYLPPDMRRLVDSVVDELARDERIARMYGLWYEKRFDVLRTYTDKLPDKIPLSQQQEFKPIRNMVIREALELGRRSVPHDIPVSQPEAFDEPPLPEEAPPELEWEPPPLPDDWDIPPPPEEPPPEMDWGPPPDEPVPPPPLEEPASSMRESPRPVTHRPTGRPHIAWTEDYKAARDALFGKDGTDPDFGRAYSLFLSEAQDGNALAMHDLGRMFADGLGRDIDLELAREWYAKALAAFLSVEAGDERRRTYAQYRIGKMYAAGLGTDQDYTAAAAWFAKAVAENHKYAQYSLGCLYLRGQGVAQDYAKALRLFTLSAQQKNAYASYEAAKLYRDGLGTEKNPAGAERHFTEAFAGFQAMEATSGDDKLQYRLGQMLRDGVGTTKDTAAALAYFEKSAKLGNVHAMYALAKLYLGSGEAENIEKAVRWLTRSADGGNDMALYSLGKIYLKGEHLEKDVAKAVELLTASADQRNQFAQYTLGKLYLTGEDVPKDVATAVELLTASSDQGNQFAQYALGKLFLKGEDVPKDIAKAVEMLAASAGQGNQYAQYALGKLYLKGEDVPKDVAKAVELLTASAGQGNQFAQYALGKLFLKGEDVPKDIAKAVELLAASAGQDNQFAQYALGKLFLKGEDVPKNISKAVELLIASAGQGNQYAQYALGKLYFMGREVERDKEKAVAFFTASAAQGNEYAAFFLEHIPIWERDAVMNAAARLARSLARMMEEDYRARFSPRRHTDRKLLQKLARKKEALGLKLSY